MNRRSYITASQLLGVSLLAGCLSNEADEPQDQGDQDVTQPPPELSIDVFETVGADTFSRGAVVDLNYRVTVPTPSEIYAAEVFLEIVDDSGEQYFEYDEYDEGVASEQSKSIDSTVGVPTDGWDAGSYTASLLLIDDLNDEEVEDSLNFSISIEGLSQTEQAELIMEDAKEYIAKGLSAYDSEAGSNRSWLSITAETPDFDRSAVIDPLLTADSKITEARRFQISDLREDLVALRAESTLVKEIARCQGDFIGVPELAKNMFEAVGEVTPIERDKRDKFHERVLDLRDRLVSTGGIEDVLSEATVGGRGEREYGGKVDQQVSEYESFRYVSRLSFVNDVNDQADLISNAQEEFDRGNYNTAEQLAEDAESGYNGLVDDVENELGEHLPSTQEYFTDELNEAAESAVSLQRRSQLAQDQ